MRPVLLLLPLALAAPAALAQTPRWQARLATEHDALEGGRGTWQQQSLLVGGRFARAAVLLEGGRVVRYGRTDPFAAVEAYPVLGAKTYGYARLRLSPNARISPRLDAHAEVFRGLGRGVEASLGARHMTFASAAVTLATASLAVDRGPWQVGVRGGFVPGRSFGGPSGSASLRLRRRFGARGLFAEALAGAGNELVATADGLADVAPTRTAALRVSVPVGRGLDVQASAGATHEGGFTRATGSLSLGVRF